MVPKCPRPIDRARMRRLGDTAAPERAATPLAVVPMQGASAQLRLLAVYSQHHAQGNVESVVSLDVCEGYNYLKKSHDLQVVVYISLYNVMLILSPIFPVSSYCISSGELWNPITPSLNGDYRLITCN